MNYSSKLLEKAVDEISQLPGIGKRTALRLALFMLKNPKNQTENLANALFNLVNKIIYCKNCYTISDKEVCEICSNKNRKDDIICVVEDVRDVMAIENINQFNGKYHVLGGKISPLEGISPSNLTIESLVEKANKTKIEEIIFALSSTLEGDTTIFFIHKQLKHLPIKFTTIARGIGVGDELEYADEITLARSIQHRIPYEM